MTTTVDELVPSTFWLPGLNFRGQVTGTEFSITAQNANGAVQLAWPAGTVPTLESGTVTVHSPTSRGVPESYAKVCLMLRGPCYAELQTAAFRDQFEMPLRTGDMRLVCMLLAQLHDDVFAGTRVRS
ncbi:hypothetical protein AB0J55_17575 [Amycolatopsis sp. NPDC049688]|uniref:hypothetical protein n=1 Tax=Amycolatopsis sp. NPDC049688 TaxID=3154733 RepID=UPI0034303927